MFTGIIDHCSQVIALKPASTGVTLWVDTRFSDLRLGESIAIDGVCLTVAEIKGSAFSCVLSPETVALTIAGTYQVGRRVNTERALRVGDSLGGHWVTGHVDSVVTVMKRDEKADCLMLMFSGLNASMCSWLIPKGSIAINGVSLTINAIAANTFSVMLVPHTLTKTNLNQLLPGDRVNIECDMLVKTIVKTTKESVTHAAT